MSAVRVWNSNEEETKVRVFYRGRRKVEVWDIVGDEKRVQLSSEGTLNRNLVSFQVGIWDNQGYLKEGEQ